MQEIRFGQWDKLLNTAESLGKNIGMEYHDVKNLINVRECIIFHRMCLSVINFGEWIERKFPELWHSDECSIEKFIKERDPEHEKDWKQLFGIEEYDKCE